MPSPPAVPVITLVVPAFNAEAFLPTLVESALAQTFSEWRMILVDDGSADGTAARCDDFARMDPRIHVIHKENGGASSARNAGLGACDTELVCFVDADDRLEPDYLRRFVDTYRKTGSDVVFQGFRIVGQEIRTVEFGERTFSKEETLDFLDYVHACNGWAIGLSWNKCYRTDALRNPVFPEAAKKTPCSGPDRGERWDPEISVQEDVEFFLRVLSRCARSVSFAPGIGYEYFLRPGSASHRRNFEEQFGAAYKRYRAWLEVLAPFQDTEQTARFRTWWMKAHVHFIFEVTQSICKLRRPFLWKRAESARLLETCGAYLREVRLGELERPKFRALVALMKLRSSMLLSAFLAALGRLRRK